MIRHLLFGCLTVVFGSQFVPCFADDAPPLTLVVMDPLALPLSCPCVQGHAQRQYDKLGTYLEKKLNRPVKVLFSNDLSKIVRGETGKKIDLIIGKQSLVKFDATLNDLPIRAIAMLTGKEGKTTFTGLFVVPQDDPAKKLEDLAGYKILFGPPDCDEKFKAAAEALSKAGVELPENLETRPGCSDSVLEMLAHQEEPMAAVISSYAAALLEGCGTIKQGAIRIIGETAPVPFVTVFAAKSVDQPLADRIFKALSAMKDDPEMLTALESKSGFVAIEEKEKSLQKPEKETAPTVNDNAPAVKKK
jgi:ABC-type phosphate/phosphonate transport system substrate-binding protein